MNIDEQRLLSEEIIFFKREDTLTHQLDQYYQDLFYRVIKIGTELECARPKKSDANELRQKIEQKLKPSKDLENLGELGVFNVIKEHCGIEIQIIGRHPHWNSLLEQYRKIIAVLWDQQVRMRPTCGLHFHLIGVGLSESIPEIILANMWNLIRRHAPGLKFLFSGGNVRGGLCRRRQHNAHQEFFSFSPVKKNMFQIKNALKKSVNVPEHQNFFNLEHLTFNKSGDLANFHIELRFPDGDLSPTSIVAKTYLFFAILLKAVEISKYGLLHIGNKTQWERKKKLMDFLSNNDGDLARSDTSKIGDAEIIELKQNSMDLLTLLKSTFNKFTNPAWEVLMSLNKRPISLRRIEGESWEDIENNLNAKAFYPSFVDEKDSRIIKIIELGLIKNKNSINEWLTDVSIKITCSKDEVKRRIDGLIEKYPVWDNEFGTFIFHR